MGRVRTDRSERFAEIAREMADLALQARLTSDEAKHMFAAIGFMSLTMVRHDLGLLPKLTGMCAGCAQMKCEECPNRISNPQETIQKQPGREE